MRLGGGGHCPIFRGTAEGAETAEEKTSAGTARLLKNHGEHRDHRERGRCRGSVIAVAYRIKRIAIGQRRFAVLSNWIEQ